MPVHTPQTAPQSAAPFDAPRSATLAATFRATSAALLATVALGVVAPAAAQQIRPVKLRVADTFPIGHTVIQVGTRPWMDEITRRSNGAITFEYYPAQQLGKAADMLSLTQNGVADVGYVGPSYVSDKMPMSDVIQLPNLFDTSCEGSAVYWKSATGGVLAKTDFGQNKVRPLFGVVMPPYQIFTTRQPVKAFDDLKGLKLRTTGGVMDLAMRRVGSVPVRMPAPEVYESLSRGTLDGMVFPVDSVASYDLQKLVKYSTTGGSFGSFVGVYLISEQAWNGLPPEARKLIEEVSAGTNKALCAAFDRKNEETMESMRAGGLQTTPLSPDFRQKADESLAKVGETWAQELDRRGKPGSQIIQEFSANLKAARGK